MKKNYRFIKKRINNWGVYSTYEVTDENGENLGYYFSHYGIDDLSEDVLRARAENERKLSVNRKGTVDYGVPFIPTPEFSNPKPSSPDDVERWVERTLSINRKKS